ncbi:Hint domain-containing protein [Frigidibacter mobilis]|uniref:Hedgehog/Intein (Hint) domain-containing protein n=1 Tax=Frigidibacter mobilis TaxID=1335048 RepID=A0A159Z029_9RHOB|nr:Hint domain-containing protein [Frigidibacter mobilis]AMY68226.1 hypothetical protein AKL17_0967 [Frigidibacter mobilis]
MSHSHRAATGIASPSDDEGSTAQLDWATRAERRPLRAMPLARRYEASFLRASGEIGTLSRLAPAMPLFEQAFSAVARGTLIATPNGPVAVEDLHPGVLLSTTEAEPEPLLWAGSITLYPAANTDTGSSAPVPAAEPARLTRMMADSFGMGRPMSDVVLGPHARVLRRDPRLRPIVGGAEAYVPVRALQDGDCVIEVAPATPVSVHHLVLGQQRTLSASGIEIESFHPGAGFAEMMDPQLLALFLSLFPHIRERGVGLDGFGTPSFPRLTKFEAEDLLAG